ncbi:MAG: radical SAM protein [Bacteroidetes bacterium RIFCSPLOWO2_12_FULL_31_6]|nr:MAG: radical SAM protein [Bacteroidetes bacterium RIFCSPLOWO2_12_FULL_31_6]
MYGIKDYVSRAKKFANNKSNIGPRKLSTLMIYATDLCDSQCKHCNIWAKRPVKYLSFEKIKEIMKSKAVSKDTAIGLEGGEFMLHPEAMEIMEWFTKNHPNFDLLSNCLKPDSLIEAVKKFPPKRLYISLDGDKETYQHMRGKDGYDRVIQVIQALKDIVPISTMFTLSPYNNFDDMRHVAEVCKKEGVDMRVGVYNDMSFFDTDDKAHETGIATKTAEKLIPNYIDGDKGLDVKEGINKPIFTDLTDSNFKEKIPAIVKEFKENYDFLVLYDEWRKGDLKMSCNSIIDSLCILPNGDVPLCQNLDVKIGNVFNHSLDEIINDKETKKTQKHYQHNCNGCWVNFHRKYDVVLHRMFEKYFGKGMTEKMFGKYQWEADRKKTYAKYMKETEAEFA